MEENIKVKLKVDLTRYGNGLVPGIEGYTIGRQGMWSRSNDNFITVCFPNIKTLDVLWDSLEIIDEEYLKQVQESNQKWMEELKTARNVRLYLGPKGGFRGLSFQYIDERGIECGYSNGFKDESTKIMKFFKENNIHIEEIREK